MSVAADILAVRGICKTFLDPTHGKHIEALRDVSISLREHEFVSIIGPSGCGKSTFLRIVAGLERPASGTVSVAGKPVTSPGADRGMVFQEYALLPWKTVQANVEFGLLLKGLPKNDRARMAKHFIDMMGLAGFEDKYPHQLSGGMRQRTAVARVLVNSPAVLLMDEPFAAVDAMTRQRLQEELTAISAIEKTTVLFVTHSIDEAVFLSDRVVVFSGRPGRVVAEVKIDFPKPRNWNTVGQQEQFLHYRKELTRCIDGSHMPARDHA